MASNTKEIEDFIEENSNLFWYSPDISKKSIGSEYLVETILNYGDMDTVRKLLKIMGIKQVSEIFFKIINQSNRRANNFPEITRHYFTLLFQKYA